MNIDSTRERLLGELYAGLRNLYGDRLDRLVLYGSYVRGEAHSGSDIDVLVVLNGSVERPGREIDRMMELLYALDLKYDELISVVPVSAEDYESKQSPLLMNVRNEGILIEQVAA